MKKLWLVLAILVLLSGCGGKETLETVADDMAEPVMAAPKEIYVALPEEAEETVLEGVSGNLYLGRDYTIAVETVDGGDLDKTLYAMTGFHPEELTILTTTQGNVTRRDFVWACTGENGEQLGRGVILDDGSYHYCLSVLRPAAAETSQIIWEDVYQSFSLV